MLKYLVVGNGVAGTTAAEQIRRHDEAGEITIVTDEDLPFYYRIRLPDYLGGLASESDLIARNRDWYEKNRITLELGARITVADPHSRQLRTAAGAFFGYDRLLLANGSQPFMPSIKGKDSPGVYVLHTVHDARQILQAAAHVNAVVLIGGGLLGLEAANGLHRLGKKITVIEFFPRLLPRQLDNEGAARLQRFFEERGYTFRLGVTTREIAGTGQVEQVILENGETLPAQMVLVSAGVRPNLELAAMLGLQCSRGVIVDRFLQTSRPEVYAAGDVIEFAGKTYGIWPAAMEQGKIAGRNIAGRNESYAGTTLANILKVAGIDLASAGEIDVENRFEAKIFATDTVYKKVVIDGRRVIGCIMLGDRENFNHISRAITTGEDILPELDGLLQG